ncbi:MAG TPA: aminotransferase class I/II-fold pyridoxal phosphate-dependent enzyme [Casimicrobiaceae bacterium]|nr:aminotransferase class I/II-fold pyridoxal phosphate-dependent enzyme [Casimicrobiaceae bacterium]
MKHKPKATLEQREIAINLYRSVWEVRNDGWIHLSDNATRLVDAETHGGDMEPARSLVAETLDLLEPIESYWAFPGRSGFQRLAGLFQDREYEGFNDLVHRISRALSSQSYRRSFVSLHLDEKAAVEEEERRETEVRTDRPYFEVLVVDEISPQEEEELRERLRTMRREEDKFIYELVVVPSFEDALIAVLFNFNIQAVVIRYGFPLKSRYKLDILRKLVEGYEGEGLDVLAESERGCLLGTKIAQLRPELDLFMVTDVSAEDIAGKLCESFHRVFYRDEDDHEKHFSILRAIEDRYQTPFFTALREYSQQPTGVFHALPISRGKSILQSHWIQDMIQFYGLGVFLAETSATSGGLDSLLEPTGPIKLAQELAARAFGAKRTFWVTNGTSTANKIVVQALIQPGDIVLLDRNCHKSHHYGMVLSGAHVVYLDAYPLNEYSMYGAVPIRSIKQRLLELKRAGRLERVKLVLLTNCTFDGIVYDVERVMEECLAIKADLIFLWDEAWFAFAGFHPTYRRRTGMGAAHRLRERFRDPEYRERYEAFARDYGNADDQRLLDTRLVPDPDRARIRVYVTHSTHKTLTALRQGSMIHVYDQDFKQKVEEAFHEAYMTHTSTSPNYQILASLDVGRRQVELEGYELVQKQVDHAMALRERIATHSLLKKYFRFLTTGDLIPKQYRPSGIEAYFDSEQRWARMEECWHTDEFVVDPTRLTLAIGPTGIDGDTFKHNYLMEKYGIQINKTSRNTVLFMTNIGTTRSSVAYLIEILVKIAQELDERNEDMSPPEMRLHQLKVESLTKRLPALPDFSHFHRYFRCSLDSTTPEGDMRKAYFMAYDEALCRYITLKDLQQRVAAGEEVVSAMFVIPYPPGFPILVPGQVISKDILGFIEALDTREIHGYRPELGFRAFTEAAIAVAAPAVTGGAAVTRIAAARAE